MPKEAEKFNKMEGNAMKHTINQISSLRKIRLYDQISCEQITEKTVMRGERFSYQISVNPTDHYRGFAKVWVESALNDYIKLYREREVFVDIPFYGNLPNENYIIKEAGNMPDILIPLSEYGDMIPLNGKNAVIWIRVDIPEDIEPGSYTVKLHLDSVPLGTSPSWMVEGNDVIEMTINVISATLPKQKSIYSRWIHLDCIALAHDVPVYSERHWMLIDKYIEAAADMGINMILVPIHTPPLDTEIGTTRLCVQLVDIEKKGDAYEFGFEKFDRYVEICKSHGIKYYELAHLFSQWGAKYSPNIMVRENGKTEYMFGWHIAADSDEYVNFLGQYVKAICERLKKHGIAENTYFHVSDEPDLSNIGKYEIAHNVIAPLIRGSKTIDALSFYEFYERGLVECPVSSVNHIHDFLKYPIKEQWVYYYCDNGEIFTNSFIASPSARVRILGYQMYKYGIKGFLQWGFNFYNSNKSRYAVDPYLSTSADGWFPSGDAFIVYPARNGAYGSIRGEVTYEAMQDIRICEALEELIGKEAVVKMIDETAGRDLRFDDYPHDSEFIDSLHDKMVSLISELQAKCSETDK